MPQVECQGPSRRPAGGVLRDNAKRPSQFPPKRVAGRGRAWYRGDCHVHSGRSYGGELTPEQLAAAAREIGLDFIATTEHNTSDTHGAWGPLAGDDLLVILGQEVTTQTGHWLALGIDSGQVVEWRYGLRDDVVEKYLVRPDRTDAGARQKGHHRLGNIRQVPDNP